MTLTPEQFDILSTKDDVKEAVEESERRISRKIDQVLNAVDGIAKEHQNFQQELAANQAAHDRFDEEIAGVKEYIGLNP